MLGPSTPRCVGHRAATVVLAPVKALFLEHPGRVQGTSGRLCTALASMLVGTPQQAWRRLHRTGHRRGL